MFFERLNKFCSELIRFCSPRSPQPTPSGKYLIASNSLVVYVYIVYFNLGLILVIHMYIYIYLSIDIYIDIYVIYSFLLDYLIWKNIEI